MELCVILSIKDKFVRFEMKDWKLPNIRHCINKIINEILVKAYTDIESTLKTRSCTEICNSGYATRTAMYKSVREIREREKREREREEKRMRGREREKERERDRERERRKCFTGPQLIILLR